MKTPTVFTKSWKAWFNSLKGDEFPAKNKRNQDIVIGTNYHTTWQSSTSMRWILLYCKKKNGLWYAMLGTRGSNKVVWTNMDDLISIKSVHNKNKKKEYISRFKLKR